jgi:type I restriction enzyme, R subunit
VQPSDSRTGYPESLNTSGKRVLYDNLGQDEALAIRVDAAIQRTRKDSGHANMLKERELRYAIRNIV